MVLNEYIGLLLSGGAAIANKIKRSRELKKAEVLKTSEISNRASQEEQEGDADNFKITEIGINLDDKIKNMMVEIIKELFTNPNKEISYIKGNINIIGGKSPNGEFIAWTKEGSKDIFVDKKRINTVKLQSQALFLVHELLHVLMMNGNKKLRETADKLDTTFKSILGTKNMAKFLTGKDLKFKLVDDPEESLTYFINGKMVWSMVSPEDKEKVKKILSDSGLFKLSSQFWQARI